MKRHALLLAWLSVLGIVAVWGVIAGLGDRVWWALPMLYGPRWIWWVALFGALPAFFAAPRRGWLPVALIALVELFGILDVRLGLHRIGAPAGSIIRVMELNADGNRSDVAAILAEIAKQQPEIMTIAECGESLKAALARLPGHHLHTAMNAICLLTRGDIVEWAERDPSHDIWQEGGSGAIARAIVSTPAGLVRVGLVHLETPRNALQMYVDKSEILKQGPVTRANMAQRDRESGLAAAWMTQGPELPTIIAGDFNLPIESAIYRKYWGGYRNAFSDVGFGTGHTKHTRLWGARIDHILGNAEVVPVRSYVGSDVGSDHWPLIADLALPAASEPGRPGTR